METREVSCQSCAKLRSQVSGLEADVEMKDIAVKQWTECANKHVDRIEELERELGPTPTGKQKRWQLWHSRWIEEYKKNAHLTRRMEVLTEALEFYADENNYTGCVFGAVDRFAHPDCADVAKEALLSAPDEEGKL